MSRNIKKKAAESPVNGEAGECGGAGGGTTYSQQKMQKIHKEELKKNKKKKIPDIHVDSTEALGSVPARQVGCAEHVAQPVAAVPSQ